MHTTLRTRRLPLTACLVAAAGLLGACGSSPRSDFYRARDIVNTPIAGTGEPLGEELAARLAADSAAFADARPVGAPIAPVTP